MTKLIWTVGFVLAAAFANVSCDKVKSPPPEINKPATVENQADKTAGERQAFTRAAQKELDELRAVIANLRSKAEAASQERRTLLRQQADQLEIELRETQQHFADLGTASAETWGRLKDAFAKSLEKLKAEIEKIRRNSSQN